MVLKWEKRTFIIEIFIKKIEINRGIMGSSTQSPGVMLVTNVLKNKRFYHLIINWRIFGPNRIWTNARHIVNGFIVHHEPTIPLAQTHKPEPTSSTLSQVWYINYFWLKVVIIFKSTLFIECMWYIFMKYLLRDDQENVIYPIPVDKY